MKEKYLYMKSKNKSLSYCKLVGEQYIFFYGGDGNILEHMEVVRCNSCHYDRSVQTYFILGNFAFEGLYLNDDDVLCL